MKGKIKKHIFVAIGILSSAILLTTQNYIAINTSRNIISIIIYIILTSIVMGIYNVIIVKTHK